MSFTFFQGVRSSVLVLFFAAMAVLAAAATDASAQTHVVSPAELRQRVLDAGRARQASIAKLSEVFTSEKGSGALRAAGLDAAQVRAAVSTLSDAELAQLSARAANAQRDFAAGALTDRDLLIILVGIAALILIIVAVR